MLTTVPLLFLFCLFYCSSSGALSVPLLPGHWAGWRPVGRCGNGDSPVCFRGFFFPSIFTSAVTCLSLVEHFWWFFKHKTAAEMSSCSLLLAPMVHKHWSITYTVVTALSCSNNVEFGTKKSHCTMDLCKKAALESFSEGSVAAGLQCCSPITFRMLKLIRVMSSTWVLQNNVHVWVHCTLKAKQTSAFGGLNDTCRIFPFSPCCCRCMR